MSLPQPNSQLAVDSSRPSTPGSGVTGAAAGWKFCGPEFSEEERTQLLSLAHDSILSALQNREICLDPPTSHFAEPRGAFTSLYLRHGLHGKDRQEKDRQEKDRQEKGLQEKELRGCVGYVLPSCPVYRAVAETARAAAFDDNRFPPVTMEEALALEIELSILSPARPIQADEIVVGRHGLLISGHGRRGLLLPQVPVEHEWDRLTFLEQTCRKAGLPLDAWKQGATIEAFTAEVFGEKSSGQ
ncbi:MAG TPA: AmmeMemoRadiSam system protein A [Candidatus Eremiobacteraceae bacterium]|nr:AmmeMemoRadiSam system protein A [Candidatus Eremiobacteraceae bacterium]